MKDRERNKTNPKADLQDGNDQVEMLQDGDK